jgi:uncharacterized protein YjbI with pentapeptide repeats
MFERNSPMSKIIGLIIISIFLLLKISYSQIIQIDSHLNNDYDTLIMEKISYVNDTSTNEIAIHKSVILGEFSMIATVLSDGIALTESNFSGGFNLSYSKVKKFLYFSHVEFFTPVKIFHDTFSYKTVLDQVYFDKVVSIQKSVFIGAQLFLDLNFNSKVIFEDCYFKSDFENIFIKPKFTDSTSFIQCTFDGPTKFIGAEFKSNIDFSRTEFSNVCFSQSEFGNVSFNGVKFDSLAFFNGSNFNGFLDFKNCVLPQSLDFSNVTTINGEIDLTQASINPKYGICYINLSGAVVEKFKLNYQDFELLFPDKDSITYVNRNYIYNRLMRVQQENGFNEGIKKLDIEYKQFKYLAQDGEYNPFVGHTINFLEKYAWGYGYKKEVAIINLIVLFLVLSLLNSLFLKALNKNVYTIDIISTGISGVSGNISVVVLKYFSYSLIYTGLIFFGLKFSLEKLHVKENLETWKWIRLVYFFFMYISGLIYLAFIANFIFKG